MEEATKSLSASKADARPIRNDTIVFRNDPDCYIAERLSPKDNEIHSDPIRILEALCVRVEPRACSRVVKQLSSTLPLEECLFHLKRVRRLPIPEKNSTESVSKSTTLAGQKDSNSDTSTSEAKNDRETRPLEIDSKTSISPERTKKRRKSNFVLEILIGTPSRVYANNEALADDHPVIREFGPLHSVMVPKYEPRSEQEWKEHNASWPTLYHPLKFDEHKRFALSETELNKIKELMDRCILTKSVLIADPKNHNTTTTTTTANDSDNENMNCNNDIDLGIVSVSQIERNLQDQISEKSQQHQNRLPVSLLGNNPLATPVLLALQGVSRREREAKVRADGATNIEVPSNGADSVQKEEEQQQRGQYICTGYDMYSFYEPNVFEAMACLHSRLRRLIYFIPSPKDESLDSNNWIDPVAWGCGLSKHDVHNLAGTNHNYRAFEYRQSSYTP